MISICTTFFNRRFQFIKALQTIQKSKFEDWELVIVDDGSSSEHRIEDLAEQDARINLSRIEPKNKNYVNCCVPFNYAFTLAKGDIILIQNPENIHCGDILSFVSEKFYQNEREYWTFACFSAGVERTNRLLNVDFNNLSYDDIRSVLGPLPMVSCDGHGSNNSWYNHSKIRPSNFHFLSCISRQHLCELNGFSNAYMHGIGFDDNEILERIKRMGLKIKTVDDPFCVHLSHPNMTYGRAPMNTKLFHEVTLKQSSWRARSGMYNLDSNTPNICD